MPKIKQSNLDLVLQDKTLRGASLCASAWDAKEKASASAHAFIAFQVIKVRNLKDYMLA